MAGTNSYLTTPTFNAAFFHIFKQCTFSLVTVASQSTTNPVIISLIGQVVIVQIRIKRGFGMNPNILAWFRKHKTAMGQRIQYRIA